MFHELAPNLKGSDLSKAMETALLKQNIFTEYMEEVVCYSKKEESADGYEAQRIGWLRSQYSSTIFALKKLPITLLRGQWDYALKLFQWLMPSRFLLIALIVFCAIGITLLDWSLSFKWYALLAVIAITFLMALPDGEVNKRFKHSIWALPILVFASVFSHFTRFFQFKKTKKKQKKVKTEETEEKKNQRRTKDSY